MPTIRVTKLKLLLLGNLDEDSGQPIPDYRVAGATHMPEVTLSRLAKGKTRPTQDQLFALAEYFCVDPNHVNGWVEVTLPESDVPVT